MDIQYRDDQGGEFPAEVLAIALSVIPGVGGVMSSTAMYLLDRIKNERLNRFLFQLSDDLKTIQEEINQNFIRKEEFRDLVEDIFSKAADTRQQEKLEALRSIFLNTIISANPQYEEIEEITNLIKSWQTSHIQLLKILDNPKKANEALGNPIIEHRQGVVSLLALVHLLLPDWDDYKIKRTWQTLFDTHVHTTPSLGGAINDRGIIQLENRLTPFGLKVADFLRNPLND